MKNETLSAVFATPEVSRWQHYSYKVIAKEISQITRYSDRTIQWMPRPEDPGVVFNNIDCPNKAVISSESLESLNSKPDEHLVFFLNGNLNYSYDIKAILSNLRNNLPRAGRVIIAAYNPYVSFLYKLASRLGLRKGPETTTFVTDTDLRNICKLSGFECIRRRPTLYVPFHLWGLGSLINRMISVTPFLNRFSLVEIFTLRPLASTITKPSLSIVIPARNERGNIENALQRLPDLNGAKIEVIFIEGHSKDGTWEEILRVQELYKDKISIQSAQQTGVGKVDAVRLGFSMAKGDLLTILDADLTMPPELLPTFYEAYTKGLADFINGTRLVYPMEGDAMRFLNRLGNIFFAKALSYVLGVRLGDSLCGTKLVSRKDYERITKWREDFGDFDPFGDFELLFPAATLGLGIVDIPVRYRSRVYGTTNISRFRHGFILLKMTLTGFFRIKVGQC